MFSFDGIIIIFMFNIIIGIDISKKKTDWCTMIGKQAVEKARVGNTTEEIEEHLSALLHQLNVEKEDVLVCAEYTGKYIYPLTEACGKQRIFLWMENAYLISLSAKKERGKSDSVDARRIAEYARKNQEDAKAYRKPSYNIARLKQLLSMRLDFIVEEAKYSAKVSDNKGYMPDKVYRECSKAWAAMAKAAACQVKHIEDEIEKLMNADQTLRRQRELLLSIPGIGPITALQLIAATAAFSSFGDARKFCCYIGVAPFSYTSGSSVHSSNRVSDRANKDLKKQLHIAAMAASTVCKSGTFRDYFERKVAEGKNKMSVLNAVRAKLVCTAFAVIRQDKPYDPKHVYQAKS